MTTRKALIERIQSMQLGTQEMLDAAKDDATLIPFETLFVGKLGEAIFRVTDEMDDSRSVNFVGFYFLDFCSSNELHPITEE